MKKEKIVKCGLLKQKNTFKEKKLNSHLLMGFLLITLSAGLYYLHFLVFHDPHHIGIYSLGDLAFLPIEVLLVTMILHRLLESREKRERLEKLNMVIGAFFSEIGTHLLAFFSDHDPSLAKVQNELIPTADWSAEEFNRVDKSLRKYDYAVEVLRVDLETLRGFLLNKRDFMLRLLGNANLLEHESFTDLLWAVFHLTEELVHRENFTCLPGTDCEHLAVDIKRAYILLVHEWLSYMQHLQIHYPHLFSLAMRLNPFDRNASLIVK